MQDPWRSYVELALGLSEASRKQAMKIVKKLGEQSGATVEQLQAVAEDLTETSAANREAMIKLIRYELDRALGAVGLATVDEVTELTERVRDLEGKLREAERRAAAAQSTAGQASRTAESAAADAGAAVSASAAVGQAPAKKRTAKKVAKTAAKKAPAKQVAPKQAAAPKKSAAKKSAAKKTTAKKSAAKKSAATRARPEATSQ